MKTQLIDIKRKVDTVGDIIFMIAFYTCATVLLCAGVYKLTRWFLS
jgi:hypothetical protein